MNSLKRSFAQHDRHWRKFLYVYPVISRRAKGLSIGVNLNPEMSCNFDCIYCQVDRTATPRVRKVDLRVLESELRQLVGTHAALFRQPEFAAVPPAYRRLNDIAFSGDGEPTAVPVFPEAARLAASIKTELGLHEVKIVVITDACFLDRPPVAAALESLDAHQGEIWAKLDAGTEAYYKLVNRPSHPLQHVLDNILGAARIRPLVIQSLFMRVHDAPPQSEIAAYVGRLRWLLDQGGRLSLVQIYTVARRTAEPYVTALTADELERIASAVRPLGVPVECYP